MIRIKSLRSNDLRFSKGPKHCHSQKLAAGSSIGTIDKFLMCKEPQPVSIVCLLTKPESFVTCKIQILVRMYLYGVAGEGGVMGDAGKRVEFNAHFLQLRRARSKRITPFQVVRIRYANPSHV